MEELCQVLIYLCEETQTYEGIITGLNRWLHFNPSNFLADICADNDEYRFCDTKDGMVSLFDYISFNDYELEQLNATKDGIKYLIQWSEKTKCVIPARSVELLRPYYDISVKVNLSTKIVGDNKTKYPWIDYSTISLETLLNANADLYRDYFYQCFCPADILYSVLHFLASNNYKCSSCDHCGRHYATRNLKNKYCERHSQYPGYENKTCELAVKEIRQDIRREYGRIYNNLYQNYPIELLNDFVSQYKKLEDELKKQSSVEIINKCYALLDTSKWYKKDSVRTVGKKKKH